MAYGEGRQREWQIRQLEAGDERQYMINERYEVYEKQGAPLGAVTFHYHNFYEIIYVLEGEYASMIEDRTYNLRRGDFLLIDQNVMHKYHFIEKRHDSSKRIILWVTEQMLEELSGGEAALKDCFARHDSCAYHFPVYYEELLRGYLLKLALTERGGEPPGVRQVMDRGYLSLFFGTLCTLCSGGEYLFPDDNVVNHPLAEQVGAYIDAHIGERITVEELAGYVHMSQYHFLRKFKELTGMTVHTFITNKRLIRASRDIRAGKSIALVWQQAGFSDYSSFLRNFRKVFGTAPGKYREFYPE